MTNIDKIIEHEIYLLRHVGCVINIPDEEYTEDENS